MWVLACQPSSKSDWLWGGQLGKILVEAEIFLFATMSRLTELIHKLLFSSNTVLVQLNKMSKVRNDGQMGMLLHLFPAPLPLPLSILSERVVLQRGGWM